MTQILKLAEKDIKSYYNGILQVQKLNERHGKYKNDPLELHLKSNELKKKDSLEF